MHLSDLSLAIQLCGAVNLVFLAVGNDSNTVGNKTAHILRSPTYRAVFCSNSYL